jgi:hypothetical protein
MLLEVPNPNDNDMGKKHAAVVIVLVALRHDDAAAAAADDDDEADIESTAASIAFLE